MTELIAGWGFPGSARKAHYFEAGDAISICGRWMYTGPREEETGTRSPSDCGACVKKLELKA